VIAPVAAARTGADELAARNWAANLRALAARQPVVVGLVQTVAPGVSWAIARDGALTALDGGPGRWWGGCSVPRAASATLLRSLDVRGTIACFLAPAHAAAIRVVLDALEPTQAVLALVPDARTLAVVLRAEDLSRDVAASRLWFAAGPRWEAMLDEVLADQAGLPIPTQFIRVPDGTEAQADALVGPAQRVFSDHTARRAARVARVRDGHAVAARTHRACVVAPQHFRLWDDAGDVLARAADALGWPRFDPDDPASAAPLALAEAVAGCDAVVTANTARADLPNVVARDVPWVTWLTAPRIPAFKCAGPRDVLLVAYPAWRALASSAGWPARRVHVAAWPSAEGVGPAGAAGLTIIANVPSLEPPRQVVEFSSHRLLWELIRDELLRDPFALAGPVPDYLSTRAARVGVAADTLDRRRFIDDLIAPAYARGLAAALVASGLPVHVFGTGWSELSEFATRAGGAVRDRDALLAAVRSGTALVHVWPGADAHPVARYGRAVVRARSSREAFLGNARASLDGPAPTPTEPPLSAGLLAAVLGVPPVHEPAD
jgi:hypothetical protein